MVKFVKGALLAGVASLAMAGIAMAQISPDINAAEFKCQQNNDKAGGKFVGALSKCATKCQQGFHKSTPTNPVEDCYAPYGGATATCVEDPVLHKGANDKFGVSIKKACDPAFKVGTDCPECYDAQGGGNGCGDSGYVAAHVQDIGNQVASFGPGVFCKTTGASTAEQKCMYNTAKVLSKLVASVNKCFDKCFKNASKSLIPGADCYPAPVIPADSATQTCISLAQTKSVAGADKLCGTISVNIQCPQFCTSDADCDTAPMLGDGVCTDDNCSAGNTATAAYPNGALWTNLVTNAIAGNVPNTYCQSPSGAFLD